MSASNRQSGKESQERMETQIIAVVALLVGLAWSSNLNGCYEEGEVRNVALRKLASHYPQPKEVEDPPAHDSPAECPLELYSRGGLEKRSLSPWRYVSKLMKDHYPPTYVEAQCLCSGCIVINSTGRAEMTHDYNSAPVNQTRVFLKQERCNDGKRYYLKPVSVVVTVGCTCARPSLA
ncbi:interleukin-17C [Syngnathus typhle]|uniref:interleukin-17C n=1 Tax=Syngnathus typhle TaxID=161592 RepID=UPI002A6B8786|nr:interleukin-17C [Syngnathus typhle]